MGKVSLNGQEDIGLVWSRGRPEGAVGKGCGVSTGSESELGEGPRPSAVPPTASCGAGGDGRMTARAVCEVRRRPAVVPPTASCGAGGDRKRTAIEGRVVSIGASRASLSAFGPAVVVLPTASCGAWGGGPTARSRPAGVAPCPSARLERQRRPEGRRLYCPWPRLGPGGSRRCRSRGWWRARRVIVRLGGRAEPVVGASHGIVWVQGRPDDDRPRGGCLRCAGGRRRCCPRTRVGPGGTGR